MNINEYYGDMPSEIGDSFQESGQGIPASSYLQHDTHNCDSVSDIDADDSCLQDTFLEKLKLHEGNHKQQEGKTEIPQLSINKTEIERYALPKQEIRETVEIANCTSLATNVNILTRYPIVNVSLAGQLLGEYDCFVLEGWEKAEVTFLLKQSDDEFGDIIDTITCQAKLKHSSSKKNYSIDVQVHYQIPKLKLKYEGCSDVTTLYGSKVAMCEIAANKWGEYHLQICFDQIERLECSLEVRGDLQIFPKQMVFFKGEYRKITFRKQKTNPGCKSAIVIRSKEGQAVFVFGVKII